MSKYVLIFLLFLASLSRAESLEIQMTYQEPLSGEIQFTDSGCYEVGLMGGAILRARFFGRTQENHQRGITDAIANSKEDNLKVRALVQETAELLLGLAYAHPLASEAELDASVTEFAGRITKICRQVNGNGPALNRELKHDR
jgi:hypothetical protein